MSLGVLALGLLAGCSGGESPSELPVPEVVWPESSTVAGLEDSEWVQVVREAETLSSVAWNHLDYSDPDLIAAWGYGTVMDTLVVNAELRFNPIRYGPDFYPYPALLDWGPNPIIPYAVEETDEGAIVTVCRAMEWNRGPERDIAGVSLRRYVIREVPGGTEITYDFIDRFDPLDPLADWVDDPTYDGCHSDVIEEAEFIPPPEWIESADEGIKYPADRKVYEELQAGDQ